MGIFHTEGEAADRYAECSARQTRVHKAISRRFCDPDFEPLRGKIDKIAETAWSTYDKYHKSPRLTKASCSGTC
jgi:hypothetical protein